MVFHGFSTVFPSKIPVFRGTAPDPRGGSGLSPCQPLLQAVRQRLRARLEGVLEAVARGRRESAMMLRVPGWVGGMGRLEKEGVSGAMDTPNGWFMVNIWLVSNGFH